VFATEIVAVTVAVPGATVVGLDEIEAVTDCPTSSGVDADLPGSGEPSAASSEACKV
jgi:hypothetical protein